MAAEVRILGPVSVSVDGAQITMGPQLRRLLALLASNVGQVVSTGRIAEALWPDEPSQQEAKAVRTYVARLRQSLGDHADRMIETLAPGYRLIVGSGDRLDAREFEDSLERAGASDLVARLAILDNALELWQGAALGEFADEAWAQVEAARLEELKLRASEDRFEAALESGLHASSVAGLEQLVSQHPFRPGLCGQLMLALHRSGRQADALRAYQRHRKVMAEAGLDASAELRLLDERIARDDPLLRLEAEPDRIRGYVRGERLGEGAFSTVCRALQPTLDRDVAIKQIRAELADRPEFIRAFEREAHLVAALENPRIVPLYDYWREVGAAYLVMRYLRGGTLADVIPRRGADVELVATVAQHVGEALQAAHARGVVHRDVKPANIFLDEVGNAYLGDFGIAIGGLDAADFDPVSLGSPAYASPEQLEGEPASPMSDLFCFAASLYEVLTGEIAVDAEGRALVPLPSVTGLRSEVPQAVSDELSKATAADPSSRHESIEEFVRRFLAALDRQPAATASGGSTLLPGAAGSNPYRGLSAFNESDAAHFFGRERLVGELLDQMRAHRDDRLLAVVGPSGGGKSSVVRAGLLPALRQGGVDGSDRWFVATMVPGVAPFEQLEVALSHLEISANPQLREILEADERGIARAVKLALPDDGSDLLLIVDQFEELYTLCTDVVERDRFSAALASAVTDPNARLRVVLTLRADFWDRPLRDPFLAPLIEAAAVHVVPLTAEELQEAIVEPAAREGCEFESGLVARILSDIAGQSGALPLLQFALTELFERREGALLTLSAYEAMGGLSGAIARRADDTHDALASAEQDAARRLFGRLVMLGDGTEDTRRRVLQAHLSGDAATDKCLREFAASRLIQFDRDDLSRAPTVEIAHEALLREWPRLRGWLSEDRADLRLQQHLERAAHDWHAAGRTSEELYRGGRLESAAEWWGLHPDSLTEVEVDFLRRSGEQADAEADRDRSRVNRLRLLLATALLALIAAVVAGLVANSQRVAANQEEAEAERLADVADAERDVAEQARLDAESARDSARLGELTAQASSLAQSGEDPDLAMLLAIEAHARSQTTETLGALQRSLVRVDGFLGHLVGEGGYLPNGLEFAGQLLVARSASLVEVWDSESRRLMAALDVGPGTDLAVAAGVAYTPGRDGLAVVGLEDLTTSWIVGTDGVAVSAVDASRDGRMLAVGYVDGTVEVWRGSDWERRTVLTQAGAEITHLALAPSGAAVLITTSGGCCEIWELDPSVNLVPATAPLDGVGHLFNALWIDDDRAVLAVGGLDVISADGLAAAGRRPPQFSLARLDERHVVHGDAIVRFEDGEVVRSLDAQDGEPVSAAVGEDVIAVASARAITLWSRDGTQLLAEAVPRDSANTAFVDRSGERVLSVARPESFTIRELSTGRALQPDLGIEPRDSAMAAWLPSGALMTYSWTTGETSVWDPTTFERIGGPFEEAWASFTTSPDGRFAAFGGFSGSVRVFELTSGQLVAELPELGIAKSELGLPTGIPEVRFSWDSAHLFAASSGVSVWSTDTWSHLAFLIAAPTEAEYRTVGVSRDGTTLAIGDAAGQVTFVATATWEPTGEALVGGPDDAAPFIGTHGLRFSSDDRFLVMTGASGFQLFGVSCTGEGRDGACVGTGRIGGRWPTDEFLHVNPSPTGRSVATASGDHLLSWRIDPDAWSDVACAAAGRSLTEDEWTRFLGDEPYSPAC